MQKFYPDRFIKKLANLQLAISLLFTIGLVVALGTIIEQDQSLEFYQRNYGETNPILGFITWKLILFLNFDHLYTSYWFLFLLFFFGASLLACTLTVQLPVLRRLRRWQTNAGKNSRTTEAIGVLGGIRRGLLEHNI